MAQPKPERRLLFAVARGALWAALAVILLASLALLRYTAAARSRETLSRYDGAPAAGRFVKAGDVELFVQEAGPGSGPAVLLLHGTLGWSGTWSGALKALAERRLRAVAVDLPPMGYSQRPDDGSYGDAAQAARLAALLDALRIPRAVVVGHSFGARAAVALALSAPQRVSKLVLADAALPVSAGESGPPTALRRLAAVGPLRDALVAATFTNPAQTRRLLSYFVADPSTLGDDVVDVVRRPLDVQGTTAAVGRFLAQAASPQPVPDYKHLRAPTLLVWGEADTATPLSRALALQKAIKGSSLKIIPRAGHMTPLEAPDAFDAALLQFMLGSGHETHPASGPSGPRPSRSRR